MNEFHPNLEKTTSSVLSVILINLWVGINTNELSGTQIVIFHNLCNRHALY